MNETMKNELVPKLRFPEFADARGLETVCLGTLIEEYKENSTKQDEYEVLTSSRNGLIRQREYYDNSRITERNNIGFNIIPMNYITYRSRSDDRRFFFNENDLGVTGIISTYYPVFRVVKGSNKYLVELLSHYSIKVGMHSVGTSQTVLSMNELKKVMLPIACTEEQQKIADCLSSLDELITAHTQKHQALQSYKKGLLQNLFPAEGETVPALRFPEYKDAGNWEVNTLEDISTFRRGSFPQPYGLPEWYDDENGHPFVQVVDVGDDMRLKPTTKRKISEAACEQSVYIEKGTVIITIQGSIGRVAVTHYDAYIDRTLLLFQCFLKPIDKYFFAYILQILFFIEEKKAPGGIIKTITKEALRSFIVKLPKLEEQQKVADCLSSVDELIAAQADKVEELKAHKKGLMQQLFPSVDEVTA